MRCDLLLTGASAVATMRGRGPRRGAQLADPDLIENGAVAIRDGKVLAVGPRKGLAARFRGSPTLDCQGGLVTPGFVDPHTHLPFAGDRSFELRLKLEGKTYEQILRAGGGIHHTVDATRKATLAELVSLTRARGRTMLEWGTTTAEAKSGYGLEWAHEEKQLKAIAAASDADGLELVPTFLGAHVLPKDPPGGRKRWVAEIAGFMVPRFAQRRLAAFVDVFLDRGAFERDEAKWILHSAKEHGLGVKLHADEFTNQEGAELAAELGATSCEHLLQVSRKGIARLAASETVAVLLPGVAELGFLDAQAPARALVEAGAAVALGTDFNPNCPVPTMPTVLQWGVYQLRLRPEEALAASTVNAACAVGLGAKVGRIQVGHQADLLVHRAPSIDELAYWVGPNPVRHVLKRGRNVRARSR